jgi:hypothetical protein
VQTRGFGRRHERDISQAQKILKKQAEDRPDCVEFLPIRQYSNIHHFIFERNIEMS